ncbi:MAG: DUF3035 domain-containing protein [Rhodobacteraceae bacterium]|nr:DUF3035 domain-containing protein [Paracoccaceae bacterium]
MRLASISAAVAAMIVAGCSTGGDEAEIPDLMQFKNTGSPDELATVVSKPIVYPDLNTELALPTPGASNRADYRPTEDAIASLGGSTRAGGTVPPASDRGIIAYATRFGLDPMIRQRIENEDLEFRRRSHGRFLERVFDVNLYYQAYSDTSLEPYLELERLRRANIRTPAAPPEPN